MKTLSFNKMGNFGRLGNAMFQYAVVLGLARKTGHSPTCNISAIPLFSDCFKLGSVEDCSSEPDLVLSEDGFGYSDMEKTLSPAASIDLRGYFQSEKYFKHIEDEIRQNFKFKKHIKDLAEKKLPDTKCVSVHIRRGDYTNLSEYHHNQSLDYYHNALDMFGGCVPVFFSDDIEWCRDNFSDVDKSIFVENESSLNLSPKKNSDISAYIDMCAMSMCDSHIITNSSFSWWGSWLGKGKTVAPKKWFGPKGPKNWSDIYVEGWHIL